MIIEYIKYCYRWYKRNGLIKSVTLSYNPFDFKSEVPAVIIFLNPVAYYKEKVEQKRWIESAKECKASARKFHDSHYPFNSCKP